MDAKEASLKIRLGPARIDFKGDAALLKGGVLDVARGLDRLLVPRIAERAGTLALDLEAARAVQEDIRSTLDSLAGMGEMESLRLQMAMDRLGKLMSTLSNLLKKTSDTADAIVQNLK
ncbi:hypothetical protein [Pseudoxanthomonas suwonensis]|nr:hypothetical protein [Pseudoxanthomonas suwonensis]